MASTKQQKLTPKIEKRLSVGCGVMDEPTFRSGVLYAPFSRNTSRRIENNSIKAIEIRSGRVLWSVDVEGDPAAPVLEQEVLYVNTSAGNVYAIDASSGAIRWKSRIKPKWPLTPKASISGAFVLVAGATEISALDAQTGKRKWRAAARIAHFSPITVREGIAIFGQEIGGVMAVDIANGKERWTFEPEGHENPFLASYDGRVYVAQAENPLYGLDEKSGAVLWKSKIEMTMPLVISGGVVYTMIHEDEDTPLIGWDISGNKLRWRLDTGTEYLGQRSFHVGRELVYATSATNRL